MQLEHVQYINKCTVHSIAEKMARLKHPERMKLTTVVDAGNHRVGDII